MEKQGFIARLDRLGLVMQIVIGLAAGVLVGAVAHNALPADPDVAAPQFVTLVGELGKLLGGLFVGALKAAAPVMVFVLVLSAVSQHRKGNPTNIRPILALYLVGTFAAALVAVAASFAFPSTLSFKGVEAAQKVAPGGIAEVLRNLLMNLVANPTVQIGRASCRERV